MAKKRKSIFRKVVGWLHLWLGLVSGLVIVIISITGCLFVFQKEFSELKYRHVFFTPAREHSILPLHQLQEIAQQALGKDQPVNYITTWKDPDRAWEFMAYKENDTALTYFGAMEYYRSAFLDPHTGRVTGILNYKTDFFQIVKYLHWSLLLNDRYGQPIVGWSTVIFVVMLITGLVLWWPKKWNRVTRKRSFSIHWKGRFRRVNYDLHNVLGFYFYIPALILALTGMVYAFQWFQSLVYAAASGTTAYPEQPVIKSAHPESAVQDPLTIAWHAAEKNDPAYRRMNITPATGNDGVISIYSYTDEEIYYNYQEMHFDRYSGNLIRQQRWDQKNPGERLIGMNYDIHVGAIGGLTGKIIAFLASLVSASLPITGFYIWWNKKKKRAHIPYTPPVLMRQPVPERSINESAQ
jgi:uncharacterized iron-regulated membrane protein